MVVKIVTTTPIFNSNNKIIRIQCDKYELTNGFAKFKNVRDIEPIVAENCLSKCDYGDSVIIPSHLIVSIVEIVGW